MPQDEHEILNENAAKAEFEVEVRRQLQRILGCRLFSKSPQVSRLLSFLVDKALSWNPADTRDDVKEYSIAVQVFGRPAGFDPTADNIVRAEIRRLRSKLDRYYADEGAFDPIIIRVPKGVYLPEFRHRDNSESDLSGRRISHYDLVRRRCANQWQETYDARCLHLQRSVTVILPTRFTLEDEDRRQSLLAATQAGVVDHPNVAAVHDVEAAANGRIIIAMASMPGRSLRQFVEQEVISGPRALHFAQEFATGIASGHSAGVFHGNLNPDSVTIEDGNGDSAPHPHIFPFGIFPLVDVEHPGFEGLRPPEWSAGHQPDMRSDVWSFGALVWLLSCGVPPPPEPEISAAAAGGCVPPQLAEVVVRCLQSDPSLRYANAIEILEDIARLSGTTPVNRIEEASSARPQPAVRSRTIALTMALLVPLTVTILASVHLRQGPPALTNPRVIVLPFENASGDANNEPYCRAVAELLAARLASVPGLYLVSSRSVGQLTSEQLLKRSLQQRLRVDYVVDGTLLRTDSRFQVTVRLMRVADGSYAWTDRYIGPWNEVFARIEELAESAGLALGLAVQKLQVRPPSRPAVDIKAYDAWLKGRFAATEYWNTLLPEHFRDAERRLLHALELQPKYVDALVDLGQLYLSAAYPPKGNQSDLLKRAQDLSKAALSLDPESGPAHAVLGSVYTDSGRSRLAMPHLLRAVQLSPHDPIPHNYLSIAYEAMGFWESGLFEREKAMERDPLLRGIHIGSVLLLGRLGRIKEARELAETFESGSSPWFAIKAHISLLAGEPKRAEAELIQDQQREVPDFGTSFDIILALAQAAQGRPEVAREAVKKFSSDEQQRSDYFVLLCALAGEKDGLLDHIAKHAYIRNYRWLVGEPLVRPYRSYPPFQKLVREIYQEWQQNLKDFGPSLPIPPPKLPSVEEYLSQL